jgi:transposase-like protein
LVDQSAGLANLLPATDAQPGQTTWRSVRPYMEDAVQRYEAGYSLSAIEKKLGIAWDSVARLLDKAGVRERKNKSR